MIQDITEDPSRCLVGANPSSQPWAMQKNGGDGRKDGWEDSGKDGGERGHWGGRVVVRTVGRVLGRMARREDDGEGERWGGRTLGRTEGKILSRENCGEENRDEDSGGIVERTVGKEECEESREEGWWGG